MTTARGFRLAASLHGALTGRGGSIIIIDDPQKPLEVQSQRARERDQQRYATTLLPRLDDKSTGAIILVMQRLHPDDLAGYLLRQGGWEHLNLPAIAQVEQQIPLGPGRFHWRPRGSLLHPEREPQETLDKMRCEMGSVPFAAQYQQSPVPPEGAIVQPEWFVTHNEEPGVGINDKIIMSWDTAFGANEPSNFSACVVGLVKGERVYILEVYRARLEFPALMRKVIEIYRRRRVANRECSLLIENKGSGISLIQQLRFQDIPVIAIQPEGEKITRLRRNTPKIEAGFVSLPFRAPWLDDFELEILAFPNGAHSDQVDAFSQLLDRVYLQRGNPARWGELVTVFATKGETRRRHMRTRTLVLLLNSLPQPCEFPACAAGNTGITRCSVGRFKNEGQQNGKKSLQNPWKQRIAKSSAPAQLGDKPVVALSRRDAQHHLIGTAGSRCSRSAAGVERGSNEGEGVSPASKIPRIATTRAFSPAARAPRVLARW